MKTLLFIAAFMLTAMPADAEPGRADADLKFRNPDLPVAERVNDLIGQFTVEEKISQLMMASAAIPRLDIPAYHWWSEALHGAARNGTATVFPQAIGLAATWNPELHQRIADVISTEARAKYAQTISRSGGASKIYEGLTLWSPNINIFRDPRWGRGQETYGEDPFLTGRMAVAFVRGLQGDDPHYLKTVATVKHYAVHSGPEPLRHRFDAAVSARDLRETYLPAFEAGIREGRSTSIMSAYNAVNGVPAPANKQLLTDILRHEWSFEGAVVGDVDTVSDIWKKGSHAYAKDAAEASADALKAGNDLCSGKTYEALPEALKRGLVTEADIDQALQRLLTLRFRLGLFDPPDRVPYTKITAAENDTPAHDQLALEAARQSLVLLKNDGTLPWNPKDLQHVAILGPTGADTWALLGNYNGTPTRPVNLVQGLRAKLEPLGVKVTFDPAIPLVAGFREAGRPFPEGVLFSGEDKATSGLKGELFAGHDFTGAVQATRADPQLDLFWNAEQPVPEIPVHDANLRWTGVLIPKQTGDYLLGLTFVGEARLFVDDVPAAGAVKSRHIGDETTQSVSQKLEAGHPYRIRIEYHQGAGDPTGRIHFGWRAPGGMEEAVAAASGADHIILTLGITPTLEGEEMKVDAEGFEGGDRTSILLPKVQRDLIDAVAKLGKPFVVLLTNGSALSFDVSKPNAILETWYYGQRGGDAVAEAIVGETNPAGRLPITFYRSDSDLPPFTDYSMANRTYRYFTEKPLYAFGHGLSYTTFSYEKLGLSSPVVRASETLKISVTVQNTGKRDGDEVVQVYATAVEAPVPMPLRQLIGFQRVPLKAGENKTVEIIVPVNSLHRWDETRNSYVVDPGAYKIGTGPSSDRLPLTATLTVSR